MKLTFILAFLLIGSISISQTLLNHEGSVVYTERNEITDSIVGLCNVLYPKSLIPILLDIHPSNDSTVYRLSYDNIYGTSMYNDIYKPQTWDQTLLGVRVYARGTITCANVMGLVVKGMTTIERLKRIRRYIIRMDFYDRELKIDSKSLI